MLKPSCLTPTTEPCIYGLISPLRRNTVRTLRASALEVQHPDPVPDFPLSCIPAYLNDHTGRFMRRDHWQWTVHFTLEDLKIGVAEPRCVDANEEFIAADGGDRDPCEGVGGVVLLSCEYMDARQGGILTLVNCAAHIVPCLFEQLPCCYSALDICLLEIWGNPNAIINLNTQLTTVV